MDVDGAGPKSVVAVRRASEIHDLAMGNARRFGASYGQDSRRVGRPPVRLPYQEARANSLLVSCGRVATEQVGKRPPRTVPCPAEEDEATRTSPTSGHAGNFAF